MIDVMIKRIGFDAYGAVRDAPDPVANAINRMLERLERDTLEAERSVAAAQNALDEATKALGGQPPLASISLEALEALGLANEDDESDR